MPPRLEYGCFEFRSRQKASVLPFINLASGNPLKSESVRIARAISRFLERLQRVDPLSNRNALRASGRARGRIARSAPPRLDEITLKMRVFPHFCLR